MKMTLHELGLKYGTDKATNHNFTPLYDEHLSNLKNEKIRLLEVGISEGLSLKMWEEYFQNGEIVGIDILDRASMDTTRIKTYIANQEKEDQLLSIPGMFDIIIDDGGHTMYQQQLTLKVLFHEKLLNGGMFILEDLHTSKKEYYSRYESNEFNNTLNLLYDLQKGQIRENSQYHITQEEFNYLLNAIESVEIFEVSESSVTSVIRKQSS